jgi:cilia- and flagella-associated protein 57
MDYWLESSTDFNVKDFDILVIFVVSQETNQKLRGETGIMKKKFTSLTKEIDDHKEEIRKYQAETAKLNNFIRNLEKDIVGLKKEIQERDETIQDKVQTE